MRDPEATRSEILWVAFREVHMRGFQAASISEILQKTSVTKGAFFHYFPTKNDLGYAIVDEILTRLTLDRWVHPLEAYANPLRGIIQNLKKVLDSTPEEDFVMGCPLNNLIQEMSSVDPIFHKKLRTVIDLWIDGIASHLERGKAAGYLRRTIDVHRVAEFVVTLQEGSFGMAKAMHSSEIFRSNYATLKEYLESLRVLKERR